MNSAKRLGTRVVTCLALMTAVIGGTATTPALAQSHTASCEFPTYQYVFVGNDGTYRDVPGGSVQGYLYNGDLLNTGLAPNTTGWIHGNYYTPGGSFKGSGWALRDYFSYVRSWC